jgi:hypothetical protein
VEFKFDALRIDEPNKAITVRPGITTNLGMFWKMGAFGLRYILSRDLRPARVRHVSRATPVYCATADHGHLNCYGDFHCEESF